METTLLAAVSECFNFKSKLKEILFEIRFTDVSRTIKFGKYWNKVLKKYEYFIHETNCPCLGCDEINFIGHLANCSGVGYGLNILRYKVFNISQ